MNLSLDYLIERKKTKKQLVKWKIFVLLLITVLMIVIGNNIFSGVNISSLQNKEYIGRIKITGTISDDLDRISNIDRIVSNNKIKALIVYINSPGGSVVGSEMLYNSINKLAKSIPVVVIMGSVAASGGYLVALAGNYIVAHNGTITGSIGVLMQSAEVTKLADFAGIKFTNFKSNKLKANPNLTEKVTPEAYQATMDSIYEVYDYFIELVASQRNLDIEYVKKLSDGRIYSGRQALDLKLVDAIGNEDSAKNWFEKERNISKHLVVQDINLSSNERFIDTFLKNFNSIIFNLSNSSLKELQSII